MQIVWKHWRAPLSLFRMSLKHLKHRDKISDLTSNKAGTGHIISDRRPYQRRKCFTCGSTSHLARDCDQKKSETDGIQKMEQESKEAEKSVKVSGVQNSGLFVTAFVNGQPVTCLIDTGATLTILSRKVWESMVRQT